jgi:hypothetical protein
VFTDKKFMHLSKLLTLAFLSLMILVGSIVEVHSHHSDMNVKSAETEKEVENSSKKERVFETQLLNPHFLLVFFESYQSHFYIISFDFQNSVTDTPHLLGAHRIALPPPVA